MRKIKINMLLTASIIVATLLFSSCGKEKSGNNLDYLAVQMSKGDSWSIIDKDGNVVVKEEYSEDSEISEIHHDVYWVKSGGKFQLYNIKEPKKPVTDEDFTSVTPFYSGVAVVSNPNQQIRIIDTDGKTVATLGKDIKRCYDITEEGYAIISNQDKKQGIINSKGNVIIQPAYSLIYVCHEGLVLAQKNEDDNTVLILDLNGVKQGEIDTKKYETSFAYVNEGKIVVKNAQDEDGPYVVLDKTGKKLFEIKKSTAPQYGYNYYVSGYLTFGNSDGKYGVANDKGEIVIRPKYEGIINNLGDGLFYARKGDKWGVIDAEDNVLVDFDYDNGFLRMGDNFLLQDGESYSLVNKEGKEIVSFDNTSRVALGYVEYVDLESLSNLALKRIEEFEQASPISESVKTIFQDLDIEKARYSSGITHNSTLDERIVFNLGIVYNMNLAEEKFHTEKVNDGWFTYDRNVSDGLHWSNAIPEKVSGKISLTYDAGINISDFYKSLLAKLSDGRKKLSDAKFSKMVKTVGQTIECQTTLDLEGENIELTMIFRI